MFTKQEQATRQRFAFQFDIVTSSQRSFMILRGCILQDVRSYVNALDMTLHGYAASACLAFVCAPTTQPQQ